MAVKLYKIFEHWYHGGTIFLYSDPHFDDSTSKTINPDWPDSEEIVAKINRKVGKNDTIIFLGDIGNKYWIPKIKGYKVLLLGNHDKGVSNYTKSYTIEYEYVKKIPSHEASTYKEAQEIAQEMRDEFNLYDLPIIKDDGYFDEVYEGPIFINEKILLSHEPIDLNFGINIHGHVHLGEQSVYWEGSHVKINVCSDIRKWEPVRLDKLIEKFSVKDLHRVTIDKATADSKIYKES